MTVNGGFSQWPSPTNAAGIRRLRSLNAPYGSATSAIGLEAIDAYIAGSSQEAQPILRKIRDVIRKSAPEAGETIRLSAKTEFFCILQHSKITSACFRQSKATGALRRSCSATAGQRATCDFPNISDASAALAAEPGS